MMTGIGKKLGKEIMGNVIITTTNRVELLRIKAGDLMFWVCQNF